MTRRVLWIVIAALAVYGAFFTYLHYREIADFDSCHAVLKLRRA